MILRLLDYPMNVRHDNNTRWILLAAVLGFIAVGLGAIASHVVIDSKAVSAIEKAALYQLIHAVVLLFASQMHGQLAKISRWLLLIGIVLFCGSIELKYLFDISKATIVAPSGGICLMLGWLILGAAGMKQKVKSDNQS